MAKHSHRKEKALAHWMPGLPTRFYFHSSPFLKHRKEIRGAVLGTYRPVGGRRPTDQPCWGQVPPEAHWPLPLAFCPRIRTKTYSCFVLQQKSVTYSPNIPICPNIPAPYQVSFVETVFGKVSQTNPLTCRTAPSVSGLKTLRCAPPSQHSSGLLGSSFRF